MSSEYAMTTQGSRKIGILRLINWKPVRFVELFIFIIVVILLTPFLDRTPLLAPLLAAFSLNIMVVCLSSAGVGIRRRWPLVILWLIGPVLDWAALLTGNIQTAMHLNFTSDLVRALLLIIFVVLILRYVLTSHEVTMDTIFGAFVAYFLIAFAFSALFHAVAVVEPTSFSMDGITDGGDSRSLKMRINYFSFVTIATLGYGDIVPRLPVPQTLAILEAVIGQFYMAAVIAWLVSVHASRGKRASGSEP